MIQPVSRTSVHSTGRTQPKTRIRSDGAPSSKPLANQVSKAIKQTSPVAQNGFMALFASAATTTAAAPAAADSLTASQKTVTAPATPSTAGGLFGQPAGAPGTDTLNTLSRLSEALKAAGIDPASLGMVAHDDLVGFPGGSYVNRLITLTANGRTENFMADLTAINPNVAVTEIKQLLAMG